MIMILFCVFILELIIIQYVLKRYKLNKKANVVCNNCSSMFDEDSIINMNDTGIDYFIYTLRAHKSNHTTLYSMITYHMLTCDHRYVIDLEYKNNALVLYYIKPYSYLKNPLLILPHLEKYNHHQTITIIADVLNDLLINTFKVDELN